jgi:hypothetical protein
VGWEYVFYLVMLAVGLAALFFFITSLVGFMMAVARAPQSALREGNT